MTTLSDGTTTLNPILWLGFGSVRESNTRTHTIIGGGTVVSMAPASPRKSTIALLFDDEADSMTCETMHAEPAVFTITEADRPTHSMQYVVIGEITRELDPETRDMWIVSAEVQEVTP